MIKCPWEKYHPVDVKCVSVYRMQSDGAGSYGKKFKSKDDEASFTCDAVSCSTRGITDLEQHFGIYNSANKDSNSVEIAVRRFSDIPVFHDVKRDVYCFLNGHCYPIRHREVCTFIVNSHYATTSKILSQSALNQVITALEGKALFDGEQRDLFNRVAAVDGDIYFDLGNGTAIKVRSNEWDIPS